MTDNVATLGMDIDSSAARRATTDLTGLATAGDRVSKSQQQLSATAQLAQTALRQQAQLASQLYTSMTRTAASSMANAQAMRDGQAALVAETRASIASVEAKQRATASRLQETSSIRAQITLRNNLTQQLDYQRRLEAQEAQQLNSLTTYQTRYNRELTTYNQTLALMAQRGTGTNGGALAQQVNQNTGVGYSTGLDENALNENARAADALRMKYNQVYASSKQYEAELKEIAEAQKIGAISTNEAAAATERARVAFEFQATAGGKTAKVTQLNSAAMTNLGYQINDVVSGLAMGQSPFQILTQQGGQFVQIMQTTGAGPVALIKGIGTALKSIINPVTIAVAVLGGLAAAFTALYATSISREKDFEAAITGTGRAAGVTASQLQDYAMKAAQSSNISVGAANEIAQTYAKTGKVTGESIKDLTSITADYAATTGQSVADATKDLANSFSNLGTGVDTIDSKIGGLSVVQKRYIQDLENSGQHNKAVQATIEAMKPSLTDHTEQLTGIGRAWQFIKNAASAAVALEGQSTNRTTQQLLDAAKARAAAMHKGGLLPDAAGIPSSDGYTPQQKADADAEVLRLQKKQQSEQNAVRAKGADEAAKQLADQTRAVVESTLPGNDLRTLQTQEAQLGTLKDNDAALKKLGISAAQATAAWQAQGQAIDSWLSPADRASKEMSAQVAALNAVTPAQKAAAAAQEVSISLAGQAITADERAARVKAAYTEALASANHELQLEAKQTAISIQGNLALAQAWQTGAGAVMEVTAHTQAYMESLTNGVDVQKRQAELVRQAASAQIAASAQQVNAADLQAKAQAAANDAVADGTISFTQAATYAQRYADTQALLALKQSATVSSNKDLVASLDQVIAHMKAANDNMDSAQARATVQATVGDLREQVKLAGMSAQEREQEQAVLDVIHQTNGKISQDDQNQIRSLVQIRQATEQWQQVVSDIQGSFADFFDDILEKGKFSFSSLVSSIQSSFARMLAQLAAEAIAQPIIIPMVQSFASQLGLGSTGLSSSGGGGVSLGGIGQALGSIGSPLGGTGLGNLFGSGGMIQGIGGAIDSFGSSLGFGVNIASANIPGLGTLAGTQTLGSLGLGSLSSALGGALGGAGIGSLASSLLFGNKNDAGTGGMAGGALGAAIGSIIPGIGTLVGGLLGGVLGGGLGSLTGSSNQGSWVDLLNGGSSYKITQQGSQQNTQMVQSVAESITKAVSTLQSAGVSITNNIKSLMVGGNKDVLELANGQKINYSAQNPDELLSVAMKQLLSTAASTDKDIQAVLNSYAGKGGLTQSNLDQFLSDIGFANSLKSFSLNQKTLTQSEQILQQINDQFNAAIQQAQQLGLSTTTLLTARDSAIKQLIDGYNQTIAQSLEQITDPIRYTFDALAVSQQARLDEAKALGADLAQVAKLNNAEIEAAMKQYTDAVATAQANLASVQNSFIQTGTQTVAQAQSGLTAAYNKSAGALSNTITTFTNLSQSLKQYSESLGTQTGGSILNQYAAARDLFQKTATAAAGGDQTAMGQLQQVAQQFLQASQSAATSAGQQASDLASVKQAVDSSAASADTQVSVAQSQLDALNEQVKGLGVLDDDVKSVGDAINDLKASQAAAIKAAQDALTAALAAETEAATQANAAIAATNAGAASTYVPHFASGGKHRGGWRMVGERGPELENTGPADIYSNQTADSLFDASGIITELVQVNVKLDKMLLNSTDISGFVKKIRDLFTRLTNDGTSLNTKEVS